MPEGTITEVLRRVPLFADADAAALRALAEGARPAALDAGEWLFRTGDAADALFVVRSGRLEVVVEGDDGPRVVRELGPGAALGELALLTGAARSASVRARRDSELVVLDAVTFDALTAGSATFARGVARELAAQLAASGGLESDTPRSRVFSVEPLAQRIDAGRLADAIATELGRFGSVAMLRGDEASEPYPALLARAERDHDAVILLGGADDAWSAFARRQADRALFVADPETTIDGRVRGHDLVLLGPLAPGVTERWLVEAEPAAHHLVFPVDYDAGARRIARRLAGRALGVVLSGGGARGFAHIGALAALRDAGYDVDRIGGCSMGAFVGAMAAMGWDGSQMRDRCHDELVRRRPFNDWTVPRVALIRSRKAGRMLDRVFGELRVEDLPRPLFTVSADLLSSRVVVHRRGPLVEAVGASMSIPGLVPPLPRGGRLLVDGGVLNNLPVDLMHDTREGPILAVDVVRRIDDGDPTEEPRLPSIMETLSRATVLGSVERAERNRELASLLVSPEVQDVGLREFGALDRAIAAGYEATARALDASPNALG